MARHDAAEHERWRAALSRRDVYVYCRAFGKAWFEGRTKEECQQLGRKAVEKLTKKESKDAQG